MRAFSTWQGLTAACFLPKTQWRQLAHFFKRKSPYLRSCDFLWMIFVNFCFLTHKKWKNIIIEDHGSLSLGDPTWKPAIIIITVVIELFLWAFVFIQTNRFWRILLICIGTTRLYFTCIWLLFGSPITLFQTLKSIIRTVTISLFHLPQKRVPIVLLPFFLFFLLQLF